jgi:hypothetical protein
MVANLAFFSPARGFDDDAKLQCILGMALAYALPRPVILARARAIPARIFETQKPKNHHAI